VRAVTGLAVCVVLWAQGAVAQEQAEDGRSPLEARWSVGAGLGSSYILGGSLLGGGVVLGQLGGVTARASLEYLLNENLALVLGGTGSYIRTTSELEGQAVQQEPQTAYGASASVGLRGFVAEVGATRFSLHGLLSLGLSRSEVPNLSVREERSRSAFVNAGFAVDQRLLGNLSVRVSADVLSVGRNSRRQTLTSPVGGPDTEASTDVTGAFFYLSPSLELRLAF